MSELIPLESIMSKEIVAYFTMNYSLRGSNGVAQRNTLESFLIIERSNQEITWKEVIHKEITKKIKSYQDDYANKGIEITNFVLTKIEQLPT